MIIDKKKYLKQLGFNSEKELNDCITANAPINQFIGPSEVFWTLKFLENINIKLNK